MPKTATQLEQRYVPDEGEKVRLLTLDHLDGRCLAVRRVRRVETEIATDLGGAAHISEGQRALCRRAAVLAAIVEDAEARWADGQSFDLPEYLSAVNSLRRILATIGLERRQQPINGDRLGVRMGE